MDTVKLWTKDFILVNIARVFSSLLFMMLSATLATYSFQTYDSSVGEAGLVVGVFIIGALFSRIVAGRYTEIVGRRALLLWGHVALLIVSFAYFVPMGVYAFVAVRFLHGMAFGVASNTVNVVGTAYIPSDRWGEGMGFFSLGATITGAIGPFIGLMLLQNLSATALFAFSTFCCVVALVSAVMLNVKPVEPDEASTPRPGFHISDYFEIKAIPLSFLLMLWGICFSGINSFMNTYAGTLGLLSVAPYFFIVSSTVNTLSRMPLGKLYDRAGDNAAIIPCLLSYIVALFLLSRCENGVLLLVIGALSGFGYGGLFFLANSIALKSSPPSRMGVAVSTFFVFADAGAGLGPLVMGLIHPVAGYAGMYAIGSLLVVCTIPAYFLLHGRRVARKTNRIEEREPGECVRS